MTTNFDHNVEDLPRKQLRRNRRPERAAVNAVRTLLEDSGLVVQEVDLANDYGKDLVVDLTEGEELTGEVIAIQIKGGPSFRKKNGWHIPASPKDIRLWRDSSVPIFGIVHDPESRELRWVDLSEYVRGGHAISAAWRGNSRGEPLRQPPKLASSVDVPASQLLTKDTLPGFLEAARASIRRGGNSNILRVLSPDEEASIPAIFDCFAIGRSDPNHLVFLRYSLPALSGQPFLDAVHALSHATSHPDIWWSEKNWIPDWTRDKLKPHLRWSASEIYSFVQKLLSVHQERGNDPWGRGSYGQSLWMILTQDPKLDAGLQNAIHLAVQDGELEAAVHLLVLLQYRADNARACIAGALSKYPALSSHPLMREIASMVDEFGWVDPF